MRQLQHLLDTDPGVPQHFHRRPRPEGGRLLVGEVPPFACVQADGVDPAGLTLTGTLEFLACSEPGPGRSGRGGGDAFFGVLAVLLDGPQQRGQ
jgi:hypothetical protein